MLTSSVPELFTCNKTQHVDYMRSLVGASLQVLHVKGQNAFVECPCVVEFRIVGLWF